jgi:hypothetical protein
VGSRHPTRPGPRCGFHRRAVRSLRPAAAGLCVVAGAFVISGASGIGVAPAADSALSCTNIWTGNAGSTDWGTASNWSAGVVPDSTGVDACIPGGTTVVDQSAPVVVGELTIAKGSSLTVGTGGPPDPGAGGATLSVTSGLDNEGTLTAEPSTVGVATVSLDGPVTNTGAFVVFGRVMIGAVTVSSLSNAGMVGIAPGGMIDLEKASSLTNASDGLLAFGIDGPPTSVSNYGRVLNGSLSLDGSVAPVFENGFVPPSGAEYVVAASSFTGTFATVRNGATADYSHPAALGLVGGAPAAATAVGVTSTIPTSVFGQDVRFRATVTTASVTAPTGSVSFIAGGIPLGSTPVTTAGGVTTASIDTTDLPVGSHTVTATYDGDVLFGRGTSPDITVTVQPDASRVMIAASPADAAPGEQVTYTASVAADAPGGGQAGGTVSLSDNGNPVSGCQALTLPSTDPRQVACNETYGNDATHSVVATYNGSPDFLLSTAALTETVAPRPTTTSVTVSPSTLTTGEPISFTATVAASRGAANPTGQVTFTDNGTPIGTSTLTTTNGVTTTSLLVTTLPLGANAIAASFAGDTSFASSDSGPVPVTVSRATTALEVVSSDGLTTAGQPVTFIANVFPATGSDETGTVTFSYNGSPIGSASVSDGQATLTTATLPIGTGSVTASYGGDANFIGSATTSTWSHEVDPGPS